MLQVKSRVITNVYGQEYALLCAMKRITLILLSWIVTYGQSTLKLDQLRIMNGNPANMGQFPYQAYITDDFTGACGASIIHKRWLLTAAHCRLRARTAYAIVGTVYKTGLNGMRLSFDKFIQHKDYVKRRNKIFHDIALIRLDKEIQFDKYVQPIELAKDELKNYTNVLTILSGWGIRSPREQSPIHLQYASLVVISEKECSALWRTVIKAQICTGSLFHENKGSACVGDSGGPLVYKNKQIGIVSYGKGRCGIFFPDVYTRVSSYVPWIQEQLQLYSDKLPY